MTGVLLSAGFSHDYDKGPASYQAPLGTICGEIASVSKVAVQDSKWPYDLPV